MINKYTVSGNEIRLFDPLSSKEAIIELLDVIYSDPAGHEEIFLIIPNIANYNITVKTLDESQGFNTERNDHVKLFNGPAGEKIHIVRKRDLMRSGRWV